ncbi:MAG: radical SAM protein [Candidatus Omnitrophota bacterium]
MKILLVAPVAKSKFLGRSFAFNLPFLSLPVLATYTPAGVDVTIVDERVAEIDFNVTYDLVGITLMTPLAPRAYEIAREFRRRGITVVMGGMHVSARPDEALEHADAIVVGEAERSWPQLLDDFKKGTLKKIYQNQDHTDLTTLRPLKRDTLDRDKYAPVEFVETTRGCPFGCHFCSVTRFFGGKYRTRPVEDVIREVATFKPTTKRFSIKNVVFFVDDNIIGDRNHAKELFKSIKPYKLNWLGQASMNLAKDDELLALAKESGCMGFLVGFESLSDEVLRNVGKRPNVTGEYLSAIRKIQSYGIGVMGSFIFGFDQDDETVFEKYWQFVKTSGLEAVYLGIMTPYPGTRFFDELDRGKRITDYDWSNYDTSHVVFKPRRMSAEKLLAGYRWAMKKSYSPYSIVKRLHNSKAYPLFVWPMNIGFHISVKRLLKSLD